MKHTTEMGIKITIAQAICKKSLNQVIGEVTLKREGDTTKKEKLNYKRIILWVLTAIYVVSPVDLMPFMPPDDILISLIACFADRKGIVGVLRKLKKNGSEDSKIYLNPKIK